MQLQRFSAMARVDFKVAQTKKVDSARLLADFVRR